MNRLGSITVLLLLTQGPPLFGQYNPYAPQQVDPRIRRAYREQAVAYAGPVARDFVETQGDEATAAILSCSQQVAKKLADFHASGQLAKMPKPRDLLRAIAFNGDDAALWAISHQAELTDVDNLDAYCLEPLQYALGLKPLAEGAAAVRARRLSYQAAVSPAPGQPWQMTLDARTLAIIGGGVVLVVLLVWWKRRRSMGI